MDRCRMWIEAEFVAQTDYTVQNAPWFRTTRNPKTPGWRRQRCVVMQSRAATQAPNYFSLRRKAIADRSRPASGKVAGSGVLDVTDPRLKVTSSMKSVVLPAAKPIDTDEISVAVDVRVT
jgi:hypothetical protein